MTLTAEQFDNSTPTEKLEYAMRQGIKPVKLTVPANKNFPQKITWAFRIGAHKSHSYAFLHAQSKEELLEKFFNYCKNVWCASK